MLMVRLFYRKCLRSKFAIITSFSTYFCFGDILMALEDLHGYEMGASWELLKETFRDLLHSPSPTGICKHNHTHPVGETEQHPSRDTRVTTSVPPNQVTAI